MNEELVIYTKNGDSCELPLDDWQFFAISQVLGLSVNQQSDGSFTVSYFPKDFVMKRVKKMGVLVDPTSISTEK